MTASGWLLAGTADTVFWSGYFVVFLVFCLWMTFTNRW